MTSVPHTQERLSSGLCKSEESLKTAKQEIRSKYSSYFEHRIFSSFSSGVGACIFDPTSGESNFLGVGKSSRGCGAASALVAVAERAMEVDKFFIAARLGISMT